LLPGSQIGIDDWACRRNQRYGTIICDIERRKTIALLPDREPATAQAWLSDQLQIGVVTRDRGGAYALAAAKAPGPRHRRWIGSITTKTASEPIFHADSHAGPTGRQRFR
jgi:hypothetical protein